MPRQLDSETAPPPFPQKLSCQALSCKCQVLDVTVCILLQAELMYCMQDVTDVWRWTTEDTQYLDSSVILYAKERALYKADWQTPIPEDLLGGSDVAVRHSGDILDVAESSGKQTVHIQLTLLVSCGSDHSQTLNRRLQSSYDSHAKLHTPHRIVTHG